MCSQIQDLLHSIPALSARATSRVEESATCATAVLAGCIRSVLISKMLDSTKGRKIGHAPGPPPAQLPPAPTTTSKPKDDMFNILQFNANGIGNKLSELECFLEKHNVKVAAIQESKLTAKSRNPRIQNFTTVRRDRPQGQGGGVQLGPRYEGQLNPMAEPIPHEVRPLVRTHVYHPYHAADRQAETDS